LFLNPTDPGEIAKIISSHKPKKSTGDIIKTNMCGL